LNKFSGNLSANFKHSMCAHFTLFRLLGTTRGKCGIIENIKNTVFRPARILFRERPKMLRHLYFVAVGKGVMICDLVIFATVPLDSKMSAPSKRLPQFAMMHRCSWYLMLRNHNHKPLNTAHHPVNHQS